MENRILVLDDDPCVLEAIDLSLTYCGFQVRPLLSGQNVFSMIDNFEPHLIILDYFLRGEDGGEICIKLKSNPLTSKIPVIMLSAHSEVGLKVKQYGYDAFLLKPFDLSLLINEIKGFINYEPVID